MTLLSNGVSVGTATLTSANVTAGFVDITASTLGADGVKSLTATIRDNAGNTSEASTALSITLDGATAEKEYPAGTHFDVPGKSGFTIAVPAGICEYICSFLT